MNHGTSSYLTSSLFLCAVVLSVCQTGVAHAATLPPTETVAQLQAKYAAAGSGGPKVQVLIVPGHEPSYGGTEYLNLKERDINVAIANTLASELKKDTRLNVIVARDGLNWNMSLATYFSTAWDSIQSFVTSHKKMFGQVGDIAFQAAHNAAPTDVALRLYGITKWANENGIDLAIHIHLNDAGDHTATTPGNQSGFAVYVPDGAYGNATTSRVLGTSIANQLNHYNATSSMAIENFGVTGDQELIALGAYNTASYASVLVEYAYIYEPKITNPVILPVVEKEFANSTYRGVESFFKTPLTYYDTLTLPHRFLVSPAPGSTTLDTYALQTALHRIGLYPANGELYYDCPVGGYLGPCTVTAIKAFQKSKGLTQTGALGPATRAALNAVWGGAN